MGEEHITPAAPAFEPGPIESPGNGPVVVAAAKLADKPIAKSFADEPIEFSNGIRLTFRQWVFVGLYTVALVVLGPSLWEQVEPFAPGTDYRIPHDLSNDYWLYERNCRSAVGRYDTIVIGDSVVWGEYVKPHETLSHYLNQQAEAERFANLGLDGAHPLALLGLTEHYAAAVKDKDVILQCNPLWLTSPRADLQDEKQTDFNHPRLVPQFLPALPCYPVDWLGRRQNDDVHLHLGVVVEQHLPFNRWTSHLQQAYYERTDIPSWTREHPYDNPLKPLSQGLPPADEVLRHLPQPWHESGMSKQDFPWVDLDTSLQWWAFRQVVDTLQRRGNRVLVLVGPFNEHMLEPESLKRYRAIQSGIKAWLEARQIPHLVPAALASEHYGDASHPLAAGYAILAKQVLEHPAMRRQLAGREP
jgi:hypothetical protein